MATSRQITSNRANAQLSTGPRSDAGKAVSSRNGLRHGLTSKQIVIPGEDPEAYDALRLELHDDYAPANAAEATLVDHIAEQTWRLQRVRRAEAAMFHILMHEESDGQIAAALVDGCGELEKIRRYEVSIERSFHRAIEQLRKLQKERRATQPAVETGFVSQSPGVRAGAILEALYNYTPSMPRSAATGFVSQEPAEPDAA